MAKRYNVSWYYDAFAFSISVHVQMNGDQNRFWNIFFNLFVMRLECSIQFGMRDMYDAEKRNDFFFVIFNLK